ncbi:MAG TPA: iron-sulfur cluster assembly accessory protein [Dehalococcoidia bacterium]|nr:iron-sulfur cluster assembly accessory protein [Dehalococcoidia bacterium]
MPEGDQRKRMLTITDKAAEKVKTLLVDKEMNEGALRVFVVGGGCAGYQYGMALAPEVESEDVVFEYEGVKVVMDPDSAPLLEGAQVDYVEDLMKSGFTVYNPNAVKSCACGTSFQTAEGGGQARPCC